MRPINLLPPEDRRGDAAPARTGSLSYVVVGLLAVVLLGVTVSTLFSKSIDDKEAEVAALEAKEAELTARAQSLSSFTSFQQLKDARVETINSLARSRFDWERVMRELALVLPRNVWLVNLTGTVAPDVSVDDSAAVQIRSAVPGPAIELIGCGRSQADVARLISAIGDIDGVTRVTAAKSELPENEVTGAAAEGGGDDCRTRDYVARFELVAAFDGVEAAPGTTSAVTPAPSPTGADGGVADAEAQDSAEQEGTEDATGSPTETTAGGQ